MTPQLIRKVIVAERTAWIRQMLESIRSLPLDSYEHFREDTRNPAAAESYLRRALEALLDLGRHILAKGFAEVAAEYKEIGTKLVKVGILSREQGARLRQLAGYRNRLVHFYHGVSTRELYEICTKHIDDISALAEQLLNWLREHPDKLDSRI